MWEVIKDRPLDDWRHLRKVVDSRFGLSSTQLLDAFFAMRPTGGERSAQFILRVEDKRIRYKVPEDQCYRNFTQFLDVHEKRRYVKGIC